jgi:serine phosphatase RsbU (regulator of sigma subunit)
MDMALISINHETNILQFSGANNPLYLITNSELQILNEESKSSVKLCDNLKLSIQSSKLLYEVKPDKMPIAIYDKMDKFQTHEIQLSKGDQIYMFSDGFADQFGGPKGKKFKYKPFKRLLLQIAHLPMNQQKEILYQTFIDWKVNEEQVDDVVIVGIKV